MYEGNTSGGTWAVLIPPDRCAAERLIHHDTLELTGLDEPPSPGRPWPKPGDEVLVVEVRQRTTVVATGRVSQADPTVEQDPDDPQPDGDAAQLTVTYTRRAFDEPLPADQLSIRGPVTPLDPVVFRRLADQLGPTAERRDWLVSLALPIEAPTPAEAVRLFWSYVLELGPQELPAYVHPVGDELAMQTYVLGAPANQDPEEDDE